VRCCRAEPREEVDRDDESRRSWHGGGRSRGSASRRSARRESLADLVAMLACWSLYRAPFERGRGRISTTLTLGPWSTLTMDIKRAGCRLPRWDRPNGFSGTVRIDPLFGANAPARAAATPSPSNPVRARHGTRSTGQSLIVTFGCGWVQREGGPIEVIRPGDVVWFEPREKHCRRDRTTAMTHIAIQKHSTERPSTGWRK